jgi:hypothetical protein
MPQPGVAALDKGWAISSLAPKTPHPCATPAGEPRLDLSHVCSPESINIYGLVNICVILGFQRGENVDIKLLDILLD